MNIKFSLLQFKWIFLKTPHPPNFSNISDEYFLNNNIGYSHTHIVSLKSDKYEGMKISAGCMVEERKILKQIQIKNDTSASEIRMNIHREKYDNGKEKG